MGGYSQLVGEVSPSTDRARRRLEAGWPGWPGWRGWSETSMVMSMAQLVATLVFQLAVTAGEQQDRKHGFVTPIEAMVLEGGDNDAA